MRPWKPNNVQDDLLKDPELLSWFQTFGPPPVGEAVPNLYAKVRTRIEEQRGRRIGSTRRLNLQLPV
jgi:hypothetical protein